MPRVAEFPDYADRRQPRRGTSLVGHQTGPRPVDRALGASFKSWSFLPLAEVFSVLSVTEGY